MINIINTVKSTLYASPDYMRKVLPLTPVTSAI